DKLAGRLVTSSWHAAPRVILAVAILIAALAYCASRLGIDTQTSALLDPDLPWRKQEIAYNAAFPQGKRVLVVVVEGQSASSTARAAGRLAQALSQRRDVFTNVAYLEGLPFFRKNGLLLQDLSRVKLVSDQLVQSAAMLGPFAADPTLRGLFDALNQALGA